MKTQILTIKKKKEFIYFYCRFNRNNSAVSVHSPKGSWLLSLVNILQSELLGQFRPTVRCVQIASVTWSDYRHVILYEDSGFMPAKRCRKPCAEFVHKELSGVATIRPCRPGPTSWTRRWHFQKSQKCNKTGGRGSSRLIESSVSLAFIFLLG